VERNRRFCVLAHGFCSTGRDLADGLQGICYFPTSIETIDIFYEFERISVILTRMGKILNWVFSAGSWRGYARMRV
jgi:hypothetical protein